MNPDHPRAAAPAGRAPAPLEPGLYFVATPIGTARDITLRALDILAAADILAAEDTRSLRKLMAIHGIALGQRPVWAYHDHSGAGMRARIAGAVASGRSVAYAAEAGSPMISDPGYALAAEVRAAGGAVTAAPGASALLAALALAGLPTDRFLFLGFLPAKSTARRRALAAVAQVDATLVIYEAPSRVHDLFNDMVEVFGEDREAAMCRELTKRFEEVRRGALAGLALGAAEDPPRGECVVVVAPPGPPPTPSDADLLAALEPALDGAGLKDAARAVADRFGVKRRRVYELGLAARRDPGADAP